MTEDHFSTLEAIMDKTQKKFESAIQLNAAILEKTPDDEMQMILSFEFRQKWKR